MDKDKKAEKKAKDILVPDETGGNGENSDSRQDSVIQEQIKPWHKRKFKKILSVIGFSLLAGLIFGIAARFVFRYSDTLIAKIFGLNAPYDQVNSKEPPNNVATPTSTLPRNNDTDGIKIVQDSGSSHNDGQDGKEDHTEGGNGTEIYMEAIEAMRKTSENLRHAMVRISAVVKKVNWLGEKIEQTESFMGFVVTQSEKEIYILSYYDKIKDADRVEISFGSGNSYIVTVSAIDESYNIAVLTISKQSVAADDIASMTFLTIGDSDNIYQGMPVIGAGSMDGKSEMTEYGYITSDSFTEYITDASVGLFTTNLGFTTGCEGIVTDLDGRLIGIVTRRLGSSIKYSVNKCIKINSLIKIVEKLCNGVSRIYLGINAEDVPAWVLKENRIENGIYVNNIDTSSPASDAGIRKGDFILSINGKQIGTVEEYSDILMDIKEITPMTFTVFRSSKSTDQQFDVTVTPVFHG